MRVPVVLTIAGSDSGGGAGIQADIKTFHALGVHGASAITSVTSQNTKEVISRFDLPVDVVISQIAAVLDDMDVAAVKTGMLANDGIVRAVAEALQYRDIERLVVDPVAVSSSGQPLLDEGGLEAIVEALLPRALVFTPNLAEASAILREVVEGVEGMKKAARSLKTLGPACVVVKGGHMGGAESPDVFFDGREMVELSAHRIRAQDDHGTGCVFSAAVAARLARGQNPLDAAAGGKMDVRRALENALRIGGGRGPVNPVPVDTTGA
jgi:hydroxymethylpyrimidine kinase/phosphomethylpyrimidine kinase